ncbi:MAG: Nif11-like leader peptide family natural product precursor [Chlorobiaceae bacterium]|nr:Nif11-like leader peptide family natural product precursor [Chlorobiaceae bacterium]
MSIDQAKAFIMELERNEKLKQEFISCSTPEERMNYAKESGFDFTADEFAEMRTELFESELDGVSGGNCCMQSCESESGMCGFDG